jgi:hypothetical protein
MVFLAILGSVALSACAPQSVWTKAGATDQDFATDSYDCERDARQSSYYGSGLAGAVNMQGFANRCMVAHGWHLEQASSATTGPVATSSHFTEEQWNAVRHECMDEAPAGSGFANAYDRCMKQHGL